MLYGITACAIIIALIFWAKAIKSQRLAPYRPNERLLLPVYGVLAGLIGAISVALTIACFVF